MPTKPKPTDPAMKWVLYHLETAVCHALEASEPPTWLDTELLPLVTKLQTLSKQENAMHPLTNRMMPPSEPSLVLGLPKPASTFMADWNRYDNILGNRTTAYDWCHPPEKWSDEDKQAYYNAKRQHKPLNTYSFPPPPIAG